MVDPAELASLHDRIHRERLVIDASARMKSTTNNAEVIASCNARIRDAQRNIEWLQKNIQDLEQRGPNATPEQANFSKLDLLKTSTPLTSSKIQNAIQVLEFKLQVERNQLAGLDKMAQLYGKSRTQPDTDSKKVESQNMVVLLDESLRKVKNLEIGASLSDASAPNYQPIRKPHAGTLYITLHRARELAHSILLSGPAKPSRFTKHIRNSSNTPDTVIEIFADGNRLTQSSGSRHDEWNESFDLPVPQKANEIQIVVYDRSASTLASLSSSVPSAFHSSFQSGLSSLSSLSSSLSTTIASTLQEQKVPIGVVYIPISDLIDDLRRRARQTLFNEPAPKDPYSTGAANSRGWATADMIYNRGMVQNQDAFDDQILGERTSSGNVEFNSDRNMALPGTALGGRTGLRASFDVYPAGSIDLELDFVVSSLTNKVPFHGFRFGRKHAIRLNKQGNMVQRVQGHALVAKQLFNVVKCPVCKEFLINGQGLSCTLCGMTCHDECSATLTGRCATSSPALGGQAHRFEPSLTSRLPSWCGHCGILLPLGSKKEYKKCQSCGLGTHNDCATMAPHNCGLIGPNSTGTISKLVGSIVHSSPITPLLGTFPELKHKLSSSRIQNTSQLSPPNSATGASRPTSPRPHPPQLPSGPPSLLSGSPRPVPPLPSSISPSPSRIQLPETAVVTPPPVPSRPPPSVFGRTETNSSYSSAFTSWQPSVPPHGPVVDQSYPGSQVFTPPTIPARPSTSKFDRTETNLSYTSTVSSLPPLIPARPSTSELNRTETNLSYSSTLSSLPNSTFPTVPVIGQTPPIPIRPVIPPPRISSVPHEESAEPEEQDPSTYTDNPPEYEEPSAPTVYVPQSKTFYSPQPSLQEDAMVRMSSLPLPGTSAEPLGSQSFDPIALIPSGSTPTVEKQEQEQEQEQPAVPEFEEQPLYVALQPIVVTPPPMPARPHPSIHHSTQYFTPHSTQDTSQQITQPSAQPISTIPIRSVTLQDFDFISVIGRGAFGKVMLAEEKSTRHVYAIKALRKDNMIENQGSSEATINEMRAFVTASETKHPFLLGLHSAFQSESRLFFVMEYASGGDLMTLIQRERMLTPRATRFYASEILLGLEFFHSKGIIYRDLKFENVLMMGDGHIKVADYGLCKEGMLGGATTTTICGTQEFIAPEVIQGKPYGLTADWWSFGVLVYEMLVGSSPFDYDEDGETIYDQVIYRSNTPPDMVSFMSGLIELDPAKRLGRRGTEEVKMHPFFRSVDWNAVYNKQVSPPMIPQVKSLTDTSNFDEEFTGESIQLTQIQVKLSHQEQAEFKDFNYVAPWAI